MISLPRGVLGRTTMITKRVEESLVYESPDGGKTVYVRKSGDLSKTMIVKDPEEEFYIRWMLWRKIIEASAHNTALKDLLVKAEMVYAVIKEQKS